MSLQSIINISDSIEIDRRRVVGIQYTRNELPRRSETPTRNPWKFLVDVTSSLQFSRARGILEAIDALDRTGTEVVSFSQAGMSWLFRYQGQLTPEQLAGITVLQFSGNQLVLTDLPTVPPETVMFEAGDFIQIGNRAFPFTSRQQVLRGGGGIVTLITHRPNILTGSVSGSTLTVGSDVEFTVFCQNTPTYRLQPGGAIVADGQLVNNALVQFTDSFSLFEDTSAA